MSAVTNFSMAPCKHTHTYTRILRSCLLSSISLWSRDTLLRRLYQQEQNKIASFLLNLHNSYMEE